MGTRENAIAFRNQAIHFLMEGCASEDYSFLLQSETIIRNQFDQDAHVIEITMFSTSGITTSPMTWQSLPSILGYLVMSLSMHSFEGTLDFTAQ